MIDRDALVKRLQSLKVVLGTDSPEIRGWSSAVQQAAQKTVNDAIALLTAPAEAPVGEVVIGPKGDVEGWTVVQWADRTPPVGTKLYTTPPRAEAEVRAGEWVAVSPETMPIKGRMLLVTNNLNALDAHGEMSHLWLVRMIHPPGDEPYYTAYDSGMTLLHGITHYRYALAAHPAEPARSDLWLPIDSAPKTGEAFIALSGRWRTVCSWNKHRGDWCISAPGYPPYPFDERPDHWHPLPADPAAEPAGKVTQRTHAEQTADFNRTYDENARRRGQYDEESKS